MTHSTHQSRKLALIIGINNYPGNSKLDYCINDANDVAAKLRSIQFHVTLGIDCNIDEFNRLINEFISLIQPGDLILFYFAGHGCQFEEKNFLLPAGYSYDSCISQRRYIKKNSVNAQDILHQIETREPRATIIILDCCRTYVKNRSMNTQQGLTSIRGSSEFLFAFSCGYGQVAIEKTLNNRNGIFAGYLLRYLTMPHLDMATILERVTKDMKSKGFPLPCCSSCLTEKIYLATDDIEDINTNSLNLSSPKPNNNNEGGILPKIRPSSRPSSCQRKSYPCAVSLDSIKVTDTATISGRAHTSRPSSITNANGLFKVSSQSQLITIPSSRLSNEGRTSKLSNSQQIHRPKSCDIKEELDTNGRSSTAQSSNDTSCSDDDDYIPRTNQKNQFHSKSSPTFAQSHYSDSRNKTETIVKEESATPVQTWYKDMTSSSCINVRSLCQSHSVKINNNTTMQELINIIWREARFDKERYTRDSHILLLFNHRLHIFIEADPNALVTDFLSLSPSSDISKKDSIDFYIYGLPRDRISSMYNIDNSLASLFGNSDSWYTVYFNTHKQSARSQSILLSSLYALQLYLRTDVQELKGERLAIEAQFFFHLRNYLFPPAILALKHAIVGCMFSFEKPLLMDALIQLLTCVCDQDKIFPTEICDFIPLLFCWLLIMCDPNYEKADHFMEVQLINRKIKQQSYFRDPVTTSKEKRKALELEEFDGRYDYSLLQHHADIRSLTLYLAKTNNTASDIVCDKYVIYDPISYDPTISSSLQYWTNDEITELYKTMTQRKDYRSFSIITRGAITADIKNQLVLLDAGRTVALLFSQKNVIRPYGKTRKDIDHFFQIFNPLKCSKEKPFSLVASDTILDEKQEWPDPRLPLHFKSSVLTTPPTDDSCLNKDNISPAHQVTIVLLDRSRSMTDYRVASSSIDPGLTHIGICKIMLAILSDNIVATNEVHAFGLIEFSIKHKIICPVTRKREQFEKALNADDWSENQTNMYDAIVNAIKQIKTFTDSPLRARKDCKKLIMCLSDGINNYGTTTIQHLRELIKKNGIVVDFISFVRDDQLKNQKEITKVRQIRDLCSESGGYIYRNLYRRSDLELAAIFEQDAAVWLSKRSRTSCGIVDNPERYISPNFQKTAVRDPPGNEKTVTSSRLRRILFESQTILNDPLDNIFVFVVRENIAFWKVILEGPRNTPYQRKFWMLYVEFDSNYPKCAPNVRFLTPIFHVNVSGDGKICHQILNKSWCQQTKMKEILKNILDLLQKPNFDDAMSLEKAHLYKENPSEYIKQAQIHSNDNAHDDLQELKRHYQLEDYDEQFEEDLD